MAIGIHMSIDCPTISPVEGRRRHAGDRVARVVDQHLATYGGRIARKAALPVPVADDHGRRSANDVILTPVQGPAQECGNAEDVEVVAGDHAPARPLCLAPGAVNAQLEPVDATTRRQAR